MFLKTLWVTLVMSLIVHYPSMFLKTMGVTLVITLIDHYPSSLMFLKTMGVTLVIILKALENHTVHFPLNANTHNIHYTRAELVVLIVGQHSQVSSAMEGTNAGNCL